MRQLESKRSVFLVNNRPFGSLVEAKQHADRLEYFGLPVWLEVILTDAAGMTPGRHGAGMTPGNTDVADRSAGRRSARLSAEAHAMLILTRKVGQRIIIGDDIQVVLVEIQDDKVRLGIEAPNSVSIHRHEICEKIHGETHASRHG